jgi:hypothetical protein
MGKATVITLVTLLLATSIFSCSRAVDDLSKNGGQRSSFFSEKSCPWMKGSPKWDMFCKGK